MDHHATRTNSDENGTEQQISSRIKGKNATQFLNKASKCYIEKQNQSVMVTTKAPGFGINRNSDLDHQLLWHFRSEYKQ